jgi:hypothetical protein
MFAILYAPGMLLADLVKSRARLDAEILLLRHQLNLALRNAPPVRLQTAQMPTPAPLLNWPMADGPCSQQ